MRICGALDKSYENKIIAKNVVIFDDAAIQSVFVLCQGRKYIVSFAIFMTAMSNRFKKSMLQVRRLKMYALLERLTTRVAHR